MTPENKVQRGEEAKAILESPLFVEAFDTIEREVIEEIKKCPVRDIEGLSKLHLMLGLNSRLRLHFEALIQSGELAKRTLASRIAGKSRMTG